LHKIQQQVAAGPGARGASSTATAHWDGSPVLDTATPTKREAQARKGASSQASKLDK